MKNFDFESKKNLIIIALVCLLFAIFIMKAFEFIPKEDSAESSNNYTNIEQVTNENSNYMNTEEDSDAEVEEDYASEDEMETEEDIEEDEIVSEQEDNSNNQSTKAESSSGLEPLETIPEGEKGAVSYISEQFADAENAVKQKNYIQAAKIYNTILTSNSSIEEKAKSYEGLASVHALNGEYGNALSYAQRACELSSSPSRELLLAKIYEKLEEPELAKQHMDNILKQDFE